MGMLFSPPPGGFVIDDEKNIVGGSLWRTLRSISRRPTILASSSTRVGVDSGGGREMGWMSL